MARHGDINVESDDRSSISIVRRRRVKTSILRRGYNTTEVPRKAGRSPLDELFDAAARAAGQSGSPLGWVRRRCACELYPLRENRPADSRERTLSTMRCGHEFGA